MITFYVVWMDPLIVTNLRVHIIVNYSDNFKIGTRSMVENEESQGGQPQKQIKHLYPECRPFYQRT